MKKNIVLGALLALLGALPLSSCGFLNLGSEGYLIESMGTSVNENGETVLEVTFDDKSVPPLSITLPKGEDGVGIANIETALNAENNLLRVTITYDDPSRLPVTIDVPIVQGKDGVGIDHVDVARDPETGLTTVEIFYTDPDMPTTSFGIPKGESGVGIESVTSLMEEGNLVLVFAMSDGSEQRVSLSMESIRGEGIQNIELGVDEDGENYVLLITFDSGFSQRLAFPVPHATEWHVSNGDPLPSSGRIGDFHLNTSSGAIYRKTEAGWVLQMVLEGTSAGDIEGKRHVVTFHPGEGTFVDPARPTSFEVVHGNYFPGELPECALDGHEFLGWYTEEEIGPNTGHFTSLTPVMADLDLYAVYQPIL